jgi:succinylglutamate desuccinylase|eukprot:scaffold10260_cov266-Chaetoceros_neogracile.AAC.42
MIAAYTMSIALVTTLFLLPVIAIANTNPLPHVNNVVVVGGTHGNEYTGVWCIKALDRKSEKMQQQFPSLKISTLLGNPEAHLANKRFIHEDLNRQFSLQALTAEIDLSDDDLPQETIRAREIDQLLGPKFATNEDDGMAHVVIDLHSTTSNMGLTIIVAEGDPIMTRAAAYVRQKCREAGEEVHCLVHTHPSREVRPNLSSAGRHGFTIEVGPVPQGVLRHDAVEKTEMALHAMFEYLHLYNSDAELLKATLNKMYKEHSFKVPCFKSATALRKGEMSGKISWPSMSHNPNFPAHMVHKNLQDTDFEMVKTGDPLFVDLEGNVIPYDGSYGSPVYLMFVNEAGYYYESSGTGVSVAIKTEYDLETGSLNSKETHNEEL